MYTDYFVMYTFYQNEMNKRMNEKKIINCTASMETV